MQRFELLGRNGAGANSTVFKCRDITSGAVVAVKKLEGCAGLHQILREAAIMRACAHKHCVELLEAYQGSDSGTVYLVMENIDHSLARELLLNPRGLPLVRAKLIAFQLAQALEQVHGKQVCHGDIKPANVLLTSQYSVKLCDFGSSKSVVLDPCDDSAGVGAPAETGILPSQSAPISGPEGVILKPVTAAASRWYCAPESLLGAEGSPASDIWALGCILAELVTGKPLMPGSEEEMNQLCCVMSMIGHLSTSQEQLVELLPWCQRRKIQDARSRGPLLERIPKIAASPELLQALRACLHPDPARRPTAQQLQAMPFFQDVRQALQATEAPAGQPSATTVAVAPPCGAGTPPRAPSLPRRTSSGNMDVDGSGASVAGDSISPDSISPCTAASPTLAAPGGPSVAVCAAALTAAPPGTVALPTTTGVPAAAATPAPAPTAPARRSGVQAAAPVRPTSRARVSALTATIRGKPFDGDSIYTDLMPLVLRLVARWDATTEPDPGLGPIALAARRATSISPAVSLSTALSGELLALGSRGSCGTAVGIGAAGCHALAMPAASESSAAGTAAAAAAAVAACATPIAAAAGGCGALGRHASGMLVTPFAAAKASGGGASPMDCGPAAPATAAAVPADAVPTAAAAAPAAACATPIAAAAGGCGALGRQASGMLATPFAAAKASGGGASPMDCGPAAPATAAAVPADAVPTANTDDGDGKPSIPISASVGAVPYFAKAAGLAPCAASAAVRMTAAHLRSRATVNRARRHHSREHDRGGPSGDSALNYFLASSSCPRSSNGGGGGLGASATLLQQELAAAAASPHPCSKPVGRASGTLGGRHPSHASRRSFADLSDLASVAEYAPLDCQGAGPQDAKRRRGLGHWHALGLGPGLNHGPAAGLRSASASVTSFGSLVTELSLGSLPENEPLLVGGRAAAGLGGGRRLRRSSSGAALATGSPVRAGGWQPWALGAGVVGAAGAGRPVSQPQPICGRNRPAGLGTARPGLGLAGSVSSDVQNSVASDVLLREELA